MEPFQNVQSELRKQFKLPPVRTAFSRDDDARLKELVAEFGEKNWKVVAERIGNHTARQCRERYKGYLAPAITNLPFREDEDRLLMEKVHEMGPQWANMTVYFPGRSDVNLKNRYATIKNRDFTQKPPKEDEVDEVPNPETLEVPSDKGRSEGSKSGIVWMSPWGPIDGFNITDLDWYSPENKRYRQELQKCFPGYCGETW
jgi:hypothetical protein